MGWDHPLRSKVQANWAIVKPTIENIFTPEQREMVQGILRGVTTEEWYPKILDQMKNDGADWISTMSRSSAIPTPPNSSGC